FFTLSLSLSATCSTSSLITVSSFQGTTGPQAHVNCIPPPVPPPNDNFGSAQSIAATPFTGSLDFTAATQEPAEPLPSCNTGALPKTLWYSFTPATSGSYSISLSTPFFLNFAAYGVYTGSSLTGLTQVACGVGGGGFFFPPAPFNLSAGTQYHIQFANQGSAQTGSFTLTFVAPAAPSNDNFANATSISSLPFSATTDNTSATLQPGEPGGCPLGGRTLWYTLTPGTTEVWRAQAVG